MKSIIKISFIALCITISSPSHAQLGFGLRVGGNLSGANGIAFSSAKKVGYQFGVDISYSFNKNVGVSVEPVYNLTRLRNNDRTSNNEKGIREGVRSLRYVNAPVYLKLNLTRGLALLGGADFNLLLNSDSYKLKDGANAFSQIPAIGYTIGIDLGALYFRYKNFGQSHIISSDGDSNIKQYQLGFKFRIF